MSISVLYNMHSFFSNFCVVQTKHGFVNVDNMKIFNSSSDANLYKDKIRGFILVYEKLIILDNLYRDYQKK
jgi:hypothetical protein